MSRLKFIQELFFLNCSIIVNVKVVYSFISLVSRPNKSTILNNELDISNKLS